MLKNERIFSKFSKITPYPFIPKMNVAYDKNNLKIDLNFDLNFRPKIQKNLKFQRVYN